MRDEVPEAAAPKCPSCQKSGLEHIISHDSVEMSEWGQPYFQVAACGACGHVYGVFAKRVYARTQPDKPETPLPAP